MMTVCRNVQTPLWKLFCPLNLEEVEMAAVVVVMALVADPL